jgi:hypothetical protein
VASHEAMDAIDWAMRTALYCSGGMAIEIVIILPEFFVIDDSMFAHKNR